MPIRVQLILGPVLIVLGILAAIFIPKWIDCRDQIAALHAVFGNDPRGATPSALDCVLNRRPWEQGRKSSNGASSPKLRPEITNDIGNSTCPTADVIIGGGAREGHYCLMPHARLIHHVSLGKFDASHLRVSNNAQSGEEVVIGDINRRIGLGTITQIESNLPEQQPIPKISGPSDPTSEIP